jgi:hypothetical protein
MFVSDEWARLLQPTRLGEFFQVAPPAIQEMGAMAAVVLLEAFHGLE